MFYVQNFAKKKMKNVNEYIYQTCITLLTSNSKPKRKVNIIYD